MEEQNLPSLFFPTFSSLSVYQRRMFWYHSVCVKSNHVYEELRLALPHCQFKIPAATHQRRNDIAECLNEYLEWTTLSKTLFDDVHAKVVHVAAQPKV